MMLGHSLLAFAIVLSRLRIVVIGRRKQAAHPRQARAGALLLILGRGSCVFRTAHRIRVVGRHGDARVPGMRRLSPGIVPGEIRVGITGTSLVSSGNGF